MQEPSFASMATEYTGLWERMQILPARLDAVTMIAHRVLMNKDRYLSVAKKLRPGLPPQAQGILAVFIGCIHYRESNLNFHCHLHNGDPLNKRTTHVPAGRPLAPLNPPFTWEESAIDALTMRGLDKITIYSAEAFEYDGEGYNGWGYFFRHQTSSYLFAGTDEHAKGKFVEDHKYDPNAVDAEIGIMPILKVILQIDQSITFSLPVNHSVIPPPIPAPSPAPQEAPVHPAWERFLFRWTRAFAASAIALIVLVHQVL